MLSLHISCPLEGELAQTGMPVRETPAQLPPQAVASDHQAPHPFPLGAGAAHLLGPANEIERYNDRRMNAVKDSIAQIVDQGQKDENSVGIDRR